MAKEKNNTWQNLLLKIFLALASILFVAGGFYVLTDYRLCAVEESINIAKEISKDIDARVDVVEDITSIIQNDLSYMRADIAEQKELSKKILAELRK